VSRYTISKRFELSYSHELRGLPEGHQCARCHGHNAVVEVELSARYLNDVGFVLDYGELAPLKQWLDETMDHRHLNEVVSFNPTAELLAHHVGLWCHAQGWPVSRVGWSETPKTWAYWYPHA
jgi:6-pyruvoyltetrahydropterin/6-carboxytetrahydropterin synthase